jgi:beta-phosphoglucomutase-like phosphatase (HAD superfamily)
MNGQSVSCAGGTNVPFPKDNLRIALFGMNDVQINSGTVIERCWMEVAKKYGIDMTTEDFTREHCISIPKKDGRTVDEDWYLRGAHSDIVAHWVRDNIPAGSTLPSLYAIKKRFFKLYKKNSPVLTPPKGVGEVIAGLHRTGWELVTVTSSEDPVVEVNRSVLGETPEYMQFYLTANETSTHKPHQGPHREALDRIAQSYGISHRCLKPLAERTIIIDSSNIAIEAGLRVSGASCIQMLRPGQKPFAGNARCKTEGRLYTARNATELWKNIKMIEKNFA